MFQLALKYAVALTIDRIIKMTRNNERKNMSEVYLFTNVLKLRIKIMFISSSNYMQDKQVLVQNVQIDFRTEAKFVVKCVRYRNGQFSEEEEEVTMVLDKM